MCFCLVDQIVDRLLLQLVEHVAVLLDHLIDLFEVREVSVVVHFFGDDAFDLGAVPAAHLARQDIINWFVRGSWLSTAKS